MTLGYPTSDMVLGWWVNSKVNVRVRGSNTALVRTLWVRSLVACTFAIIMSWIEINLLEVCCLSTLLYAIGMRGRTFHCLSVLGMHRFAGSTYSTRSQAATKATNIWLRWPTGWHFVLLESSLSLSPLSAIHACLHARTVDTVTSECHWQY